ncbi:hypothetical protein [Ktedonospora formicarum]|uniref:DNA-binding protein n=1 Tax=Ktedonospora formicarum TaxID=2778364 RepID=A0A8J3IA97_9CHLR|nr:hypothetical protein [Ktedonospora formicarum]GHO50138.1 hypothetical protein KSX_83010 [Ktedonospora formicarum]
MTERKAELMRITARYVEEVQAGKAPSLTDYLRRYPQYQGELLDFVTYYHAFESTLTPSSAALPLSDLSRTSLERAYAQIEYRALDDTPHTLLLSRQREELSVRDLADALELSPDIVLLLEKRALLPASLPRALPERLSDILGYSVAQMESFFDDSRSTSRKVAESRNSYSHKESSSQDTVSRQIFSEILLASSDLLPAHREKWLAILAQEKRTIS